MCREWAHQLAGDAGVVDSNKHISSNRFLCVLRAKIDSALQRCTEPLTIAEALLQLDGHWYLMPPWPPAAVASVVAFEFPEPYQFGASALLFRLAAREAVRLMLSVPPRLRVLRVPLSFLSNDCLLGPCCWPSVERLEVTADAACPCLGTQASEQCVFHGKGNEWDPAVYIDSGLCALEHEFLLPCCFPSLQRVEFRLSRFFSRGADQSADVLQRLATRFEAHGVVMKVE